MTPRLSLSARAALTIAILSTFLLLAPAAQADDSAEWFTTRWPTGALTTASLVTVGVEPVEQESSDTYALQSFENGFWSDRDVEHLGFDTGGAFAIPATLGATTYRVEYRASWGVVDGEPTTVTIDPAPVVAASRVSVSALRVVRVHRHAVIRGRVTGAHRPLLVQERSGHTWRTVMRLRSNSAGRFDRPLPRRLTAYYGSRPLRISAPATATYAAVVSRVITMRVRPAVPPAASAPPALEGYRWNPCGAAIPVHVNLDGGGATRLALVQRVLYRVAIATGLRFHIVGPTSVIPGARGTEPVGLTVAFANPSDAPSLDFASTRSGGVIGWGGADRLAIGGRQIISASAVIDDAWTYQQTGFAGNSLGAVLMHEVGHAIGLDHSPSPTSIMSAYSSSMIAGSWTSGDLQALEQVGADRGCL